MINQCRFPEYELQILNESNENYRKYHITTTLVSKVYLMKNIEHAMYKAELWL